MGRVIQRVVVSAFIVAALCVAVAAQQPPRVTTNNRERRVEPTPQGTTNARVNASENVDENFELNIVERRITEHDFYASTAIETGAGDARGVSLRIGVAVGASEIDVLLRNVRGSVRFRGSLDALRRVLDAHRETTATPQPSVP